MSGIICPSYKAGFASPQRGRMKYPGLWRNCVFAAAPLLGPTGTTLRDQSHLQIHDSLTSTDQWSVKGGLNAVNHNGTSQGTTITTSPFSGETKITLSLWAYVNAYAAADGVLFEHTTNFNSFEAVYISLDSAGNVATCLQRQLSAPAGYNGGTFERPPALAWNHLYFEFNRGSGTAISFRVWVNGIEKTVTQTYSVSMDSFAYTTQSSYVGARAAASLWANLAVTDIMVFKGISLNLQSVLSRRPGIAYETASRRSYKAAAAAGNRRRRLLIGS